MENKLEYQAPDLMEYACLCGESLLQLVSGSYNNESMDEDEGEW